MVKQTDVETALRLLDIYNALSNWTVTAPRFFEIHAGWTAAKSMRVYVAAVKARKAVR
jgi:hypothetical protein